MVFLTSSMALALTVGTVRSIPRMFSERELNDTPKMTSLLGVLVPLGATVILFGVFVLLLEDKDAAFDDVENVAEISLKVITGPGF